MFAECEGSTPVQLFHNTNIMPHEQRALNFLINEHLLNYGYKLTSITFADENEDQVLFLLSFNNLKVFSFFNLLNIGTFNILI